MKHPEKKDRRVTFFKGMMVVFLNLCLWVTPDEIVCSSPKEPLTKPIAEIISVDTGAVKINRNGETLPTEKNMELYEGDIITINRSCISLPCLSEDSKDRSKIDQSSLVTLRCLSGNLKDSPKTDPPCITLLCSPEDWKDSSEDVSSFSIKKLCSFNEQKSATQEQGKSTGLSHFLAIVSDFLFPEPVLTAPGAARKWDYLQAAIVDLVAPAATNVLTRQPHFQWLPLPGATQYELTLFDGLNTILWSQTTTETELVYPPEAPALVPGDYYFWQVKGVTTSDGEENSFQEENLFKNVYATYGMTYFTVLPDDEIAAIQQEVEEARRLMDSPQDELFTLIVGTYYEKKQLYGEAQAEYEKLLTFQPQNELYKKMLTHLYVTIGRKWAAADLLGLVQKKSCE